MQLSRSRSALSWRDGRRPERSTRLVTRLIEEAESRPGELDYVIAECVHLLMARSYSPAACCGSEIRSLILRALDLAVPARDRVLLGVVLGQLTDPRIEDTHSIQAYVEVPHGDYLIGEERRLFHLAHGILMSRFPVTNSQFGAFIADGGYGNDVWWSDEGRVWRDRAGVSEPLFNRDSKWNGPTFPVVGVTFWEAQAFAHWSHGRLPTVWEREAAALGPKGAPFPGVRTGSTARATAARRPLGALLLSASFLNRGLSLSALTIWPGMYGNGVTALARRASSSASFAGAHGMITRGSRVPRIASPNQLTTGSPTWAFASFVMCEPAQCPRGD